MMRVRMFGTGEELVVDQDTGNRMIARAEAQFIGNVAPEPAAPPAAPAATATRRSVPGPTSPAATTPSVTGGDASGD